MEDFNDNFDHKIITDMFVWNKNNKGAFPEQKMKSNIKLCHVEVMIREAFPL